MSLRVAVLLIIRQTYQLAIFLWNKHQSCQHIIFVWCYYYCVRVFYFGAFSGLLVLYTGQRLSLRLDKLVGLACFVIVILELFQTAVTLQVWKRKQVWGKGWVRQCLK